MKKIADSDHGKRNEILQCKAEDYFGLPDFLLCLEDSVEGEACIYRVAIGSRYFCTSQKRISHFRNYGGKEGEQA